MSKRAIVGWALGVGVSLLSGSGLAFAIGADDSAWLPVIEHAPVREIACLAEAGGEHADLRLRLSADGAVRQGTLTRTSGKGSPDERLDVVSVSRDGARVRIVARSRAHQYRFSIAAAALSSSTPQHLAARVEESNDPAMAAPAGSRDALSCVLGDATRSAVLVGSDAEALFNTLDVPVVDRAGDRVKVVDTGSFRLACSANAALPTPVCSVRMPAHVDTRSQGRVTYGVDLGMHDSLSLASALGTGAGYRAFVGTSLADATTHEKLAGSRLTVRCKTAGACRVDYTVPDRFFETNL
jgi:hypothetical protein